MQILNTQTLCHFDNTIREAFHHDIDDHLSEFYRGKVFTNTGSGEIEPGGFGSGSKWILEYVYDFGSSAVYQIELIEEQKKDSSVRYPKIIN